MVGDLILPEQRGRCRTCGYLAERLMDSSLEPALREVNEAQRNAFVGEVIVPGRGVVSVVPHCYVKAADLEREYGTPLNRMQHAALVFDRDRKCPKWHPYTPGFGPREHLAHVRAQQEELERKKYQERQEENRRQFELAMQRDSKRFQIKITIVLAIIAFVAALLPFALARFLK
ncbi:MAG TPA: hypothetical protein VEP50_05210 [bacterium]|nr:hypothetical protein [bacterium]